MSGKLQLKENNYNEVIGIFREAANKASKVINEIYQTNFKKEFKLDQTPLTKADIEKALKVYELFLNEPESTWTWGDGDSIDRERIRSILENQFNFKES